MRVFSLLCELLLSSSSETSLSKSNFLPRTGRFIGVCDTFGWSFLPFSFSNFGATMWIVSLSLDTSIGACTNDPLFWFPPITSPNLLARIQAITSTVLPVPILSARIPPCVLVWPWPSVAMRASSYVDVIHPANGEMKNVARSLLSKWNSGCNVVPTITNHATSHSFPWDVSPCSRSNIHLTAACWYGRSVGTKPGISKLGLLLLFLQSSSYFFNCALSTVSYTILAVITAGPVVVVFCTTFVKTESGKRHANVWWTCMAGRYFLATMDFDDRLPNTRVWGEHMSRHLVVKYRDNMLERVDSSNWHSSCRVPSSMALPIAWFQGFSLVLANSSEAPSGVWTQYFTHCSLLSSIMDCSR